MVTWSYIGHTVTCYNVEYFFIRAGSLVQITSAPRSVFMLFKSSLPDVVIPNFPGQYDFKRIMTVVVLCHCCPQHGALIGEALFATGLEINPNRPNDRLPYGGVWLNVGSPSQMIHLMELPNPDPKEGRPQHGGRDRHACVSVKDVMKIKEVFDKAGISYTFSQSGRPAIFARDPDGNALEFSQL